MFRILTIFGVLVALFSAWAYYEISKVNDAVDKATGTTEEDRFRLRGML